MPTPVRAPAAAPPLRSPHFAGFDGLRAIAAFCVVGMHVGAFSGVAFGPYGFVTSQLNVGVTIFFLISGFLLYRPHAVELLGGPPPKGLGDYAARRVLRIVPAYWVALTVLALWPGLQGVFTGDWWIYYGFLQSYRLRWFFDGLPVAWSLSVEAAFYVALPILALALATAARGVGPPARARLAGAGLALLGVASLVFVFEAHRRGWQLTHTLLGYFFAFSLGMGLAVASARLGARERDSAFARFVGDHPGLCWLAAVAVYVAFAPLLPVAYERRTPLSLLGIRVHHASVAFLLLLPAVFGEGEGGWPRRLLQTRTMTRLGEISYGVFLWHHPLLAAMKEHGVANWIPGRPFLSLAIGIVPVSILAGWLSFRLVELPAMRVRGGLRRGRRSPDAPPAGNGPPAGPI